MLNCKETAPVHTHEDGQSCLFHRTQQVWQ